MKVIIFFFSFLFTLNLYGQNTLIDSTFKIPSFDKKWELDEFRDVFIYILDKEKDKKNELPSHKNNQKDLFVFITNFENYWFIQHSSKISIENRLQMIGQITTFLRQILFMYARKSTDDNGRISYERELIDIMILTLKLSENMLHLAQNFMSKNDNTLTKIQLDGLDRMKNGVKTMIESGLYTFEKEYLYYSHTSICKYALAFKDFYLFSKDFFTNEEQLKFKQKIIKVADNHQFDCVKKTLSF